MPQIHQPATHTCLNIAEQTELCPHRPSVAHYPQSVHRTFTA
jgi:hypothetical protein